MPFWDLATKFSYNTVMKYGDVSLFSWNWNSDLVALQKCSFQTSLCIPVTVCCIQSFSLHSLQGTNSIGRICSVPVLMCDKVEIPLGDLVTTLVGHWLFGPCFGLYWTNWRIEYVIRNIYSIDFCKSMHRSLFYDF